VIVCGQLVTHLHTDLAWDALEMAVSQRHQQDSDVSLLGHQSRPAVPDTVNAPLAELADESREELRALAVGAGLQVMAAIMEEDVIATCGHGRHDPERVAMRHGHGAGSMSMGERRVPVERHGCGAADGAPMSCRCRRRSCSPTPRSWAG
jgi:hypothetical protein